MDPSGHRDPDTLSSSSSKSGSSTNWNAEKAQENAAYKSADPITPILDYSPSKWNTIKAQENELYNAYKAKEEYLNQAAVAVDSFNPLGPEKVYIDKLPSMTSDEMDAFVQIQKMIKIQEDYIKKQEENQIYEQLISSSLNPLAAERKAAVDRIEYIKQMCGNNPLLPIFADDYASPL